MASSPSASPPPGPLPHHPPPQSQSHSPSLSVLPKHESFLLPLPGSRPTSPPKKSPPLPWTHQETLALIQAYQDKWYSLKKGQLKSFQWEEVSVTVAARCGYDEQSKTSTQCRHKIEKLRKRYRSELQKPYPNNSWQYFKLMDQMERGPMPLNARPIAVVKSFPNNANSNSHNSINITHVYGSLYSSSADYYNNDYGDGGGSDASDEKWNGDHGLEAETGNKSNSINYFVRGDVMSGVRRAKRVAMEGGFRDDDGDDDDDENDHEDDVKEEGEEGGGGMEFAATIRGFAEQFIGMENKKIEMLRETERYRMEMENKRMEMIHEAQRKIIDTIDRAFGAHKKAKMSQET
ncbi:hypothetical protein DH2020_046333 [Rehmannia glutinosa]|uniref:Myb/SANT-like DNA-binding domain-containing protein n=1 Tax=Rehmannia glutinosa TaxID=99300 RepID=A0ABR0UBL9_REHGL